MQHYDADWIATYFDQLGMGEWDRLMRSPADEVSLHIHSHYLAEYIHTGDRVLEIGAGAGRFTQVLADLGAQVVVADISPGQIELNRQMAAEHGFQQAIEEHLVLDICHMPNFAGGEFDAVVAYGGPLSYVFEARDGAVAECNRILKPSGHFLTSVMSLWGTIHRHLEGVLAIPAANNRRIIATGDIKPDSFPNAKHFMHMFRARELNSLLAQAGLEVLAMSASGCLSLRAEEYLEEQRSDASKWAELLRCEVEACREPGCIDMGTHLLAVARKPKQE